jgi:polyhydroxybutyrate depolymerase
MALKIIITMRILLIALFFVPQFLIGQQTTRSFTFDNQNREYIQYIPSTYTGNEPVPVIFSLHGLGDNMNNFSNVGFHNVADTANIIVITPQALVDGFTNATAWNSGAGAGPFILNQDVDDVGFISALIDTLTREYNIDPSRVFATGFSMGGFMSNRLACELNSRIAAIASVAGTIGIGVTCVPNKAIPTCHFHGTADQTVAYEGNQYGNDAEPLFAFWADNNSCTNQTDSIAMADIKQDGITVTKFTRNTSCENNAESVLYRADNAEHTWLFTPTNDIDYTTEIWKFFMDKNHPNPDLTTIHSITAASIEFDVFPNPAKNTLNISVQQKSSQSLEIRVYDSLGRMVLTQSEEVIQLTSIDIATLLSGAYIVQVDNGASVVSRAFNKL